MTNETQQEMYYRERLANDRPSQPTPKESKLKTLLLGTPGQIEARQKECEKYKDRRPLEWTARVLVEPGYALRIATYLPKMNTQGHKILAVVLESAKIAAYNQLAIKLGQMLS